MSGHHCAYCGNEIRIGDDIVRMQLVTRRVTGRNRVELGIETAFRTVHEGCWPLAKRSQGFAPHGFVGPTEYRVECPACHCPVEGTHKCPVTR